MYNKVILAGNLARDIEIRYTQGGSAIGKTAIATNRKFKSQTGEQKEEVMFIDLTFFGRTAEIANQYLRKGSKVLVDGRLTLDQWTAQDGSKRSKHSITVENLQMLGSRDEMGAEGSYQNNTMPSDNYRQPEPSYNAPSQPQSAPQQKQQSNHTIPEIDISEDEIPF
ncbi:single-stranded DNA-binding protein [Sulfurovum mangrovi]|jgi:single-strand DNA-binding protein|uniref:single-stranded DNA-binding protein n=1 Tax=Sulfurovum mangrovi TaxID=2893889 RepID=UPI001E35ACD7|nr:single-stranded DNA-binding protein [Sulfurovum mangrovi]UFH59641.1 single-stranded DNA-binding protein [Sulfurovum mangrovi]UFH60784.1 single-stranded DNA-binding protein [Sulfurovum mangrovi]